MPMVCFGEMEGGERGSEISIAILVFPREMRPIWKCLCNARLTAIEDEMT